MIGMCTTFHTMHL